jgi:hypothetical protein
MKNTLTIDVLGFDGCPNVPLTLELVEAVVRSEGVEAKVNSVDVNSIEDAERLHFLGSPTVQINGIDIESSRRHEEQFSYSCRVYRLGNETSGVPPETWLRSAIQASIESMTRHTLASPPE